MATQAANGSAQSIAASRTAALQALLSKLSPEDVGSDKKLTPEQLAKISDKLGNLLGEVSGSERVNERGELLNEEGLPIVDITEPVHASDFSAREKQPSASLDASSPDLSDLTAPSLNKKQEISTDIDAFFDLLEAEEAEETVRSEQHERLRELGETERRKANAANELKRLQEAKAMQKKMGKALLRELSDERPSQKPTPAIRMDADGQKLGSSSGGKKVTFAEGAKDDSSALSLPSNKKLRSVDHGYPMKYKVVERGPTNPIPATNLAVARGADSDEDSASGSIEETSERIPDSSSVSSQDPDDSDDELPDDPVLGDEFDFDEAMHQREIALAYYEKRANIGQDAARAMAAHSHEPTGDDWDQPDVPLDATLSQAGPKLTSKFKASRVTQAYGTTVPRSTPSTSLGESVLPGDAPTFKSSIRLGKLESGCLVGGEAGESGSELEDDDEDVRVFMEALRRGEVTNAGVATNSDALIAALTAAYGGPVEDQPRLALTAADTPSKSQVTSAQPKPPKFKPSKFKRMREPATSDSATSSATVHQPPLRSGSIEIGAERRNGVSSTASSGPTAHNFPRPQTSSSTGPQVPFPEVLSVPAATPSAVRSQLPQAPPAPQGILRSDAGDSSRSNSTIRRPLFPEPPPGARMPSMIVESPDFPHPNTSRPSRPPTVMSTSVFERKIPISGSPARDAGQEPVKKASRFMAGRSR